MANICKYKKLYSQPLLQIYNVCYNMIIVGTLSHNVTVYAQVLLIWMNEDWFYFCCE